MRVKSLNLLLQLSIAVPVHTNKTGDQTYEIAVYTGMFGDSGTTAHVSMYISGEKGESEVLPLQDRSGAKRPFSRGSVSSFVARWAIDLFFIHTGSGRLFAGSGN